MTQPAPGRPTLVTVARAAGVSRQTVSNVINSPHLVSPETLELVRSVLDSVGYRPNLAARQLRTGRSGNIGLRMRPSNDGINGAVLDGFLHALTEAAQAAGHRIVLFTATDDADEVRGYRELVDTTNIDGFVLTDTHHGDDRARWLEEQGTAFVTFGRPWSDTVAPETSSHSWVDVDGAAGTAAATAHLLGRGHTRIGFIGWPAGSGTGDERRTGWRRTLLDAGLPIDGLDVACADGIPDGASAADSLLRSASVTALVCASDSLALGALGAARTSAQPIAVVGYDNTAVAAAVGMSSVAQPLEQVARSVIDSLLAQLADPVPPDAMHRLVAPSLVARASSTAPAHVDPRHAPFVGTT
ncbi:substrate-binding domain-containing protein [Cellulomonas sp. DKR-3]|uniref:Substrate-binding domain-containing protein n=1 Tax=Cellulomonas fulva TaxID=2835530 RepID=A0ABS5TV47_9CELL|nr:substrate-binding domain-containing protein [Cellulomonas fulva]MBT0992977.1 substrate-binding domain-containing protein [Cellulomonas fulva]